MTPNEAIEWLLAIQSKYIHGGDEAYDENRKLAIKTAISAIKKQIPKKPRETRCALMCANCSHKITEKGCKKLSRFYCKKCGQKIDWSDAE